MQKKAERKKEIDRRRRRRERTLKLRLKEFQGNHKDKSQVKTG